MDPDLSQEETPIFKRCGRRASYQMGVTPTGALHKERPVQGSSTLRGRGRGEGRSLGVGSGVGSQALIYGTYTRCGCGGD